MHDSYTYNKYLNETNHLYKAGSKVQIDYIVSYGEGDLYSTYAHIKDTDEYIYRNSEDDDYLDDYNISMKQSVPTQSYSSLFTSSFIPKSKLQVYDLNGQAIEGKTLEKNDTVHVDGLFYLYNSADKKVEPYYHIQDQYLVGRWFDAENGDDEAEFKPEKEYNGFVKASDIDKVNGKEIEYQNTEDQAKTAGEKASDSSLKELASKVSDAEDKKDTDLYRLTDYVGRYYYDYAIKYAKQISEGRGSAQLEDSSSSASQSSSSSASSTSSSSASSSSSSAASSSSSQAASSSSSASSISSSTSAKTEEKTSTSTKAEVDLATWLLKDSASYLNGEKS